METAAALALSSTRNDALLVFIDLPNVAYKGSSELMFPQQSLANNFIKFPLDALSQIIAERFSDNADEIEAHLYSQYVNADSTREKLKYQAKQAGFKFVTTSNLSTSISVRKDIDHLIINSMWRLTSRLAFDYVRGRMQTSSGEPRNGVIEIVLVSGDGDFYQTLVDITENLERFNMKIHIHIVGWRDTMHQAYKRSSLVQSITYLDDFNLI